MFNQSVYINRRAQLKTILHEGIVLIPGNCESPMNYVDNTYRFRQDSTFLYFFGIDLPDLYAIIDLEGDDYIFGDDLSLEDIVWNGIHKTMDQHAFGSGVNQVKKKKEIGSFLSEAQSKKRKIHFLPQYRSDNKILISDWLKKPVLSLNQEVSVDLIQAIVQLRSVKEDVELIELKHAADIGYQMHVTAMKMAIEGKTEREIAGVIEGIAASLGGGISFPIILSQRGEILHNHGHAGILKKGNLMVVDAGAESNMHYASDFTRTVPVGHEFNTMQRDIYNIVLAANNHALNVSKPGVLYLDVHLEVAKVIATGLKEIGLMKGNLDEAVAQGAHALFFPHGLGHMLGLDVHDMENYGQIYVGYDDEVRPVDQFGTAYLRLGRRLQKGFVITNEPGIYFIPQLIEQWKAEHKFEDFINYNHVEQFKGFGGIRLEDDLYIDENGAQLIGERIPITVDEIANMNEIHK